MSDTHILRIEQDHARFRQIVKGKVRQNLREYVARGELIGKKGKDIVSIPVPYIDPPRFEHDFSEKGGVGEGEGEVGTSLGPAGQPREGEGEGGAGNVPGRHLLEVEVTLEELAQILGEKLELPRIRPKGQSTIESERQKYSTVRRIGPDSLVTFRRTYKESLKRMIAADEYDPANPVIVPIRRDKRYLSWRRQTQPRNNALIIYMMDVSGSMRDEQKEIVRIESFWIDTWLRSQYKGIESRYIVHDAVAQEVDRERFFSTRESGGTVISSAYELCARMIEERFSPQEWNIYPFHFSDGDNWSEADNQRSAEILRDRVLPAANMFGYGQVKSRYGSGKFYQFLEERFAGNETVTLSLIEDRNGILDSIRDFFKRGR